MTVDQALRALRARWWLVVACLLLGLAGAAFTTYLTPRQYSSDVTLFVSLRGQADNPDAAYQANELAKERVLSYAPLLTDERITQAVIDELQLAVTPVELAERIAVSVEPDTTVLSAAVTDTSPQRAADVANSLAGQLAALVAELEDPIGPPPPPPARVGDPVPEPPRIGVELIRPAAPAPDPVSPSVPFNLALGAALGLLIGVAAALVRDGRDTSVRSPARLRELTAAPVLGEIARDRQVLTRPLIIDDPVGSARAEAFRKLRTNLQFLDAHREHAEHAHRVFVITGARVGEGTSTTACNLATALAESGNRVILVDANLRNPQVSDYLGLDPGPGLVNVLLGRIPWPHARQRWNRGALDVLPAGPTSHNPSQLLASPGLGTLLGELRRQYDFVIVDTPALLPVSDAAAVAARADGVVLVVQHRRTSEEQVSSALKALDAVSARLAGTVLTMTKGRPRSSDRMPTYRGSAAPAAPIDVPQPTEDAAQVAPHAAAPSGTDAPVPAPAPHPPPAAASPDEAAPASAGPEPSSPNGDSGPEAAHRNGTQPEVERPRRRPSPTPRR